MQARICFGCLKPRGVFAFSGAYWHLACFRRATPADRDRAASQMSEEQRAAILMAEEKWKGVA
jgi:hypothetical protein